MVKTFLDFSRPVDVKLTEVDLVDIAREVAELTTPQARLAGIHVWFEAAAPSAPIRGDADMLKQAILNLVLNAIEAMKNGGNLWVRVSRGAKPGGAECFRRWAGVFLPTPETKFFSSISPRN